MPLIVEMRFAKRYSSSRMLFWNEYLHMYIARVRVSFDAFVVYVPTGVPSLQENALP
jgi:hypothetical protein